jgi:small nuclear ribonucleoprotein (snRNP)-like protein
MTARPRIFSLPIAAATLAVIGLTASPIAAGQAFRPQPPANTQTQWSFLASPEFSRLIGDKSIVVITKWGRVYEGYFVVSGNVLIRRGPGAAVVVPFEQVMRVEKSTFRMRTHGLIGLGIGFTVGILLANDACDGDCRAETWSMMGLIGASVGSGMGARNGAMLNRWNFENDILFDIGQPFETRLASPVFARFVRGKDVWVTTTDGTKQRGEIAAVTENGLILTGPQQASLPLDQIMTIVEVSHRLRNGVVSGLAGGASVGVLACQSWSTQAGCGRKLLGLTAIGVGTGLAVAAVMNLDKNRDLLHDSGRKTRTLSFAPILSPKRKGMAFRMTWR